MKTWSWCLLMLLAAACGKKTESSPKGLAHGVAILNSDYHSTALTLLNPNNDTVIDPCLTSGSVIPRLSLALSGDVVLPTQAGNTNSLVLIDRDGNNAVLWLDPNTCTVQNQIALGTDFKPDPHDALMLSPTKGYVTRYNTNTGGTGGGDILIVNASTATAGNAIDLSSLATQDANNNAVDPRPDRLVLAGGVVFVSLAEIDSTFTSYGAGRVAQIDPASDTVIGHIDIADLQGCSGLATAGKWLAVGCDGDYSDPNQAMHSGIALYDITDPHTPTLSQTITAAQLSEADIDSNSMSIHGDTVYFIANNMSGDTVYALTSAYSSVTDEFSLGSVATLANGTVLFTDGNSSNPAVVITPSGGTAKRVVAAPKSVLPPRQMLVY